MDKINSLLGKRLNKLGLYKPLEAARIVAEANKLSNGRFRAISFSRGCLAVACSDSIQAQETHLDRQNIIDSLNKRLGQATVQRLKFRIDQ